MGKSWRILLERDPRYRASSSLVERDPFHGVDEGWAEQVVPFVEEFSRPGDVVFDPFAGLGTTLCVAVALERDAFGTELHPQRVALINERLSSLCLRSRAVEADATRLPMARDSVDVIITNVPYYSPELYGSSDYEGHLRMLDAAFAECRRVLRPGRRMVVFAENLRSDLGEMIPFAFDVARLLGKHFTLRDERLLLYERHGDRAPSGGDTDRSHEYALVAERRVNGDLLRLAQKVSRLLQQAEVSHALIGSFGLALRDPHLLIHPPSDLDFVMANDPEIVRRAIECLNRHGFETSSWGEPAMQVSVGDLRERQYLRAMPATSPRLPIDLTYAVPTDSTWSADDISEIPVASLEFVLELMGIRESPVDRSILRRATRPS